MVEDSITTFETFCRHQDIAIISADQALANKYREVIRTYASFADPSSQSYSSAKLSPPLAIRWRNAGLRAIKGVVSSESLAADGGTSLNIILPVILENLYSPSEDVLIPLKAKLRETDDGGDRDAARIRRLSVATVDTAEGDPALAAQSTADVDRQAEMDARLLALRCLEQIVVSGSNRGQIRIAATVILRFIANKKYPRTATRDQSSGMSQQDGNWATSLIELIATWCPVQVRFVILMTAMDILHDTTPKEDALESSFTILSVVDWLLKSPVNMIGLSVMDILLGLMRYIADLLSPTDGANGDAEKNADPTAHSAVFISPRRRALLSLLEQCIGNLATHNYYGDQVADMMRAILRRFKPTPNYESAAQSSLATVHETRAVSMAQPNAENEQLNGEKAQGETFSHAAAKLTALRAVKAILVVANLRVPPSIKGSETRNQVGIHVWEGTQGLLRDSDQEVRHAYADAFLSWLQLETNKQDLKVRLDTPKYVKPASKRDSEALEKTASTRRSTSAPGNQREKAALAAQTNFLRLLHLDIYDAALDRPAVGSEVLVLHLLLASLVENLGVNAAQFGLPMVLKLQEDLFTSVDLGSFAARVNVGSLVHGYLLALAEKFNLESTHAGVEIRNEIEKRQTKGQWFSKIKLPPTGLDGIAMDEKVLDDDSTQSITLTPFRNVDGLVNGIDEAYRQTISSPPQSPPTSPARGFNFPVLNHTQAAQQSQPESGLPSAVKEQMLSSWSRESCLAAIEKESIRTASISGSRGNTMTRNSHFNGITNGSPVGSAIDKNRPTSVPDISYTPEQSSGRGSPVRVTELRRVLSVNTGSNLRRRSPLRDQVDASNISVISSGSESMVSGAYSVSEMEPDAVSTLEEEGQQTPEDAGTETPRANASSVALSSTDQGQGSTLSQTDSHEIPPVPPIPAGLSIPGGFPNDSQRSLVSDRPSTAPDNSRQTMKSATKSEASQNLRNGKALNRNKSRSSNNLAYGFSDGFYNAESNDSESPLDTAQRDQLRKLLDGFLSPEDSVLTNGNRPSTAVPTSKSSLAEGYSSRRQFSGGGLGRPPY